MTDTILLRAEELASHFGAAGVTLKAFAQAVLECAPVDEGGNAMRWPATGELRIRHLVRQLVKSPHWPDQPPVPGLNVMSTVVAEKASHLAMLLRRADGASMVMSPQQVAEMFKAAADYVKPHLDDPVAPLLRYEPAKDGLFSSYVGDGVEGLERKLSQSGAGSGKPLRRLVDTEFEGLRLVLWRQGHDALADKGEKVVDMHALLYTREQQQVGYARLRLVVLPPQTRPRDLVYILDAYDSDGLELGVALKHAYVQESLDEYLLEVEGLSLMQVIETELHQAYRGQGLGVRFLRRALNAAVKGLRPQPRVLAMAVKPMQFDFPLKGLPADLLLEALDAVAALQQHLDTHRPQDAIRSLAGSDILYLSVDERARGTHFEQLSLLAEDKQAS